MRVLVLGTGVTGEAVGRHFRDLPGTDVILADDRPVPGAVDPATVALATVDLVVPSPGVRPDHSLLRAALERAVPVRAEIDLALELARARGSAVVAITGTNGKTTVTTWTTAMLDGSGVAARAAGNIGTPLLDAVAGPAGVVVAEVSSFQLHFTTDAFRPRVAVVLNVAADHLDWHGSVAAYQGDKARIARAQEAGDLLVVNVGDPGAAALATGGGSGRVVRFEVDPSEFDPSEFAGSESTRGPALVRVDGAPGLPEPVLAAIGRLPTRHDAENAAAAALAAREVGATTAGIVAALRAPPRLHHRVELVGQAGGVRFYDDSKATNPHATRAAVEGFDRVVLLAGGHNKALDLGELRPIASRLRAVIAIGDARDEVAAAFAGVAEVVPSASMREAVEAAARAARPGDVVLLSPGCASFDWYTSYAERGEDFAREVRRVTQGQS